MEDSRAAVRELQATIGGSKGTRTSAMTIQVVLGTLRAAYNVWIQKTIVHHFGTAPLTY